MCASRGTKFRSQFSILYFLLNFDQKTAQEMGISSLRQYSMTSATASNLIDFYMWFMTHPDRKWLLPRRISLGRFFRMGYRNAQQAAWVRSCWEISALKADFAISSCIWDHCFLSTFECGVFHNHWLQVCVQSELIMRSRDLCVFALWTGCKEVKDHSCPNLPLLVISLSFLCFCNDYSTIMLKLFNQNYIFHSRI